MAKPALVAHCDWSTLEKKRWMAVAVRLGEHWRAEPPEPVEETATLIERLKLRRKEPHSLLIGFDFPIGLPIRYAQQLSGITDFRHALREFGSGEWSDWYEVGEDRSQISIRRPFYPTRPGGRSQAHLLERLNIKVKNELLRRCERRTNSRRAACMLFWTLGGNQVGKAAISGWRQVIAPKLDLVGLWPFDGPLRDLLEKFPIVLAETYPGDVYAQLGIPKKRRWSKRRQEDRQAVAEHLQTWLSTRQVATDNVVTSLITQGFAAGAEGEDQFDAMVGLFGMLDVVEGRREEGASNASDVRKWEGWILGQAASQETVSSGNTY